MAQTTYVEHMPILYDPRGCDYTNDYSSDVSSPASSSGSPQHSPLLSDDGAANLWFNTNPVEVTCSGYINDPYQEYTSLAPMDSSCLQYVDPQPEVERHMPRSHHRGNEVLKIEKRENQVYAVFGMHSYSIDPEDKFDVNNCYTSNVAKAVVTHTTAEESVSIFYPQPPRRTQGTSRSKRLPRAERLWEFILRLLLDSNYNPSHIEWVDREKGMFRLVNSRGIARMWGKRKNNLDMTYEKLSRAMRYYYHRKILQPVFGKKLVYKFGPNSTGWQLN